MCVYRLFTSDFMDGYETDVPPQPKKTRAPFSPIRIICPCFVFYRCVQVI